MTRPLVRVLALPAAIVTIACGSSASTSTNVTAPASDRCQATVTSSAASFGPAGGTGTLSIAIERECSWRATSPVTWIMFTSSAEGQGDGTVGYRVSENSEPAPRQAALSVANRQVSLSQQPAPCQYVVNGPSSAVAASGGDATIEIRTHSACSWTAESAAPWASVSPSSGSGNGEIRVTAAANTGSQREAVITVAGQRVSLRQNAPSTPAPPPTPAPAPPAPTPPPSPTPTPEPSPTPTPPPPNPEPTPPPPPPTPTPPDDAQVELEGQISAVTGPCPTKTFTLRDRIVYTTSETEFHHGTCSDLKNKALVDVRGTLMPDGRVRADRIDFEND